MANIFKNFLDSMRLTDDDDDEAYEDYVNEELEKEDRKAKRLEKKAAKQEKYEEALKNQTQANSSAPADFKKERMSRMERSSAGKVVPIRSTSELRFVL